MKSSYFKFSDGSRLKVGTIYGIGKNYALHAKEMNSEVPDSPIIFIKPPAAYLQNNGTIKLPSISNNVHHEVELVVVISQDCESVEIKDAVKYIAGYGVGIDVTLRDIQAQAKKDGHPWAIAKGFASSAPISTIIPASSIKKSIKHFDIKLKVNGEVKQSGSTSQMERSVEELISYISKIFTLRKGDCIFTGTPEGVGQIKSGDRLFAELVGFTSINVNVE